MNLEPDFDALLRARADMAAKKRALELWKKSEEEPDGVGYQKTHVRLPKALQFKEDGQFYPKFLPCDENRQFPLDTVYGGARAYRGGDRPQFTKAKGMPLPLIHNTSALVVLKDFEAENKLVAFGYPYQSTQQDSYEEHTIATGKMGSDDGQESDSDEEQTDTPEEQLNRADTNTSNDEEQFQNEEPKPTGSDTDKLSNGTDALNAAEVPGPEADGRINIGHKKDPRWLKVSFRYESQCPFVRLLFPLDPSNRESRVTADIFAQHLRSTKNTPGIDMSTAKQNAVLHGLPIGEDLEKLDGNLARLAKEHSLWRTDIRLAAATPCVTTGVSYDQGVAIQRKDRADLTDGERFLLAISRANSISIFTESPCTEEAALKSFFKYFRTVMYAAAHLGNFWWYSLVTSGERDAVRQAGFPFDQVPIPRWMVRKWRIEYRDNKEHSKPRSVHIQQCCKYSLVSKDRLINVLNSTMDKERLKTGQKAKYLTLDANSSTDARVPDMPDGEDFAQLVEAKLQILKNRKLSKGIAGAAPGSKPK